MITQEVRHFLNLWYLKAYKLKFITSNTFGSNWIIIIKTKLQVTSAESFQQPNPLNSTKQKACHLGECEKGLKKKI